ncbi:MAG: (d)CMP kinase, partial [Chlamydiae bacterium]|nr:(d)CMP kinase [Chlamydiota bacterium]
ERSVCPTDSEQIRLSIAEFSFRVETREEGFKRYFVGDSDVSSDIRSEAISSLASQIAKIPDVREALVPLQRRAAEGVDVVCEGRDMGTIVFPWADLKIFLTASAEVRAQRRYQELIVKFPDYADSYSLPQILEDIVKRDRNDSMREISPLRQAPDAILIDTSRMTVQQVLSRIIAIYQKKMHKSLPKMKWSYRCVYWLARGFFSLFFRLRVKGLEHFRPGSGIIASNHVSLYDPEVVSISCPEEVHFLAKEPLFRIPILGSLIRVLNAHPVSRDSSDVATFKLIIRLLAAGRKVILFPEGGRSKDGDIQPLEKGLPFLVHKAKCPIFPVYVSGAFEAWPKGRKFPKLWGRIQCSFGPPIEWAEFEKMDKKEAMQAINAKTYDALKDLKIKTEIQKNL